MSRVSAFYQALLRCYPGPFRHEYGDQMLAMFAEQLQDARRPADRVRLWLRAATDVFTVAPKEHVHVIVQDLRYAFSSMLARPGFAIVAILSLALGIGANTAIFGLWNNLLFAPLPGVAAPDQLVMLTDPARTGMWRGRSDGERAWLTYPEFMDLKTHATSFSALMASQSSLTTWQTRLDGDWEDIRGRLVSREFFEVLGASPTVGRFFSASDRDTAAVAVISHHYWQRRFGGRTDILGRTMTIRQLPLTIVGVANAKFIGETAGQLPDVWIPIEYQPSVNVGTSWLTEKAPEKVMWLHVFGRLKPNVTHAQAKAEANAVLQANLTAFYGMTGSDARRQDFLDQQLELRSGARGASPTRANASESLSALLVAVGVLLLIACVNLANLLLARGAARRSEIALRLALGASRARLVRQLVTESLALSAIGGLAALFVASLLHGMLVRMMAAADNRFAMDFYLDPTMVTFVAGISVAAGLLFGVLPAWSATRTDAGDALKEHGRGAITSRGQLRSGRVLVGLQLALSLPLLVGAGLLAQTVANLQGLDLGFPSDRLLLLRVDLSGLGPEIARREAVMRELQRELSGVAGVKAVSYSHLGVFSGGTSSMSIAVDGFVPQRDDDEGSAVDAAGPGYFATLGIPLLQGREFLVSDTADSPRVCIINEAFAQRFFAGRNPVGLRVSTVADDESRTPYQIVGVVGNSRTDDLRDELAHRFYMPTGQRGAQGSPFFVIRTTSATSPAIADLRAVVQRVDASLPVRSVVTLHEQMAPLVAQDRTTAQLVLTFGAVALLLAAIGLYGVLSYGISRRSGEIAVRMALGAERGRVIRMILRETAGLVVGGLVVGIGIAYAGSGLIASRLYGVAPQDPMTLTVAIGLLLAVALVATYLPARRASKLEPIVALQQR